MPGKVNPGRKQPRKSPRQPPYPRPGADFHQICPEFDTVSRGAILLSWVVTRRAGLRCITTFDVLRSRATVSVAVMICRGTKTLIQPVFPNSVVATFARHPAFALSGSQDTGSDRPAWIDDDLTGRS